MIKRIIFDVDDTLFPSSIQYENAIIKSLEQFGIVDKNIVDLINKSYNEYEKYYDHYEKDLFINFFNATYSFRMSEELYDVLNNNFVICGANELEDNLISTLEYLHQKYELVILTNFISEVQINRIKNAGIGKYFQDYFCGDKVLKPNCDSYFLAAGKHELSECMVVGDSVDKDYNGPKKCGLNATLYDKLGRYPEIKERINNLIELKEIL